MRKVKTLCPSPVQLSTNWGRCKQKAILLNLKLGIGLQGARKSPKGDRPHSHCRGRKFETCIAHHVNQKKSHLRVAFLLIGFDKN